MPHDPMTAPFPANDDSPSTPTESVPDAPPEIVLGWTVQDFHSYTFRPAEWRAFVKATNQSLDIPIDHDDFDSWGQWFQTEQGIDHLRGMSGGYSYVETTDPEFDQLGEWDE